MKVHSKYFLPAAMIMLSASAAQADSHVHTYVFTESVAQTLRSIGISFVAGCTVFALGIVAAAVVLKKK